MSVTKLERRIEELAEAMGKSIYVGRQGHKSEWFAGCAVYRDGTPRINVEGYGSTAEQALDALVIELRKDAEKAERKATEMAANARRLNAITK